MSVYKAINAVQAELARDGITKDRKNAQQGYSFRGIDDVYNALSPLLAKHGLCILPRILRRASVDRETKSGGVLFYVTVEAEFDFVCAEDGSKHTVRTFGEAMDSGDKATNKAMSAAYKYAAFQAFAIPTEADNDADAHTHQVKPVGQPTSGVWESLTATQVEKVNAAAVVMQEYLDMDDLAGAIEYKARAGLDADETVAFWTCFKPYERAALKKAHDGDMDGATEHLINNRKKASK
jgi:hypothetical protein